MKIRTKSISYEEAMRLPSWKHKRPRKPSGLLAGIARMALGGELKKVDFSVEKVDMEKAGDGPWMILMNHCSFTDLSIACFPKEGDIVAKTRLAAEELYKTAAHRT